MPRLRVSGLSLILLVLGLIECLSQDNRTQNPDQAVSYERDIAPILGLHCNRCHGDDDREWWPFNDAGGLNTRSYEGLMQGGSKGRPVVPYNPYMSLLMYMIRDRGSSVRMPLFSPPLSSEQISLIDRWIREGAKNDRRGEEPVRVGVDNVLTKAGGVEVMCLPTAESYLELVAIDPATQKVLSTQVASAKWNSGYQEPRPGTWIRWRLPVRSDWPDRIRVELRFHYFNGDPTGTIFVIPYVGSSQSRDSMSANAVQPDPVAPEKDSQAKIAFWLGQNADVRIAIGAADGTSIIYEAIDRDLGRGTNFHYWNLRSADGSPVKAGRYAVQLQLSPVGRSEPTDYIAILFGVRSGRN